MYYDAVRWVFINRLNCTRLSHSRGTHCQCIYDSATVSDCVYGTAAFCNIFVKMHRLEIALLTYLPEACIILKLVLVHLYYNELVAKCNCIFRSIDNTQTFRTLK